MGMGSGLGCDEPNLTRGLRGGAGAIRADSGNARRVLVLSGRHPPILRRTHPPILRRTCSALSASSFRCGSLALRSDILPWFSSLSRVSGP
eukprot:2998162-Rhodomonas_salina.1